MNDNGAGNLQKKVVIRMTLIWLLIVIGFPMFCLASEAFIPYLTSPNEMRGELPGTHNYQKLPSQFLFLTVANIPSTGLIALASLRLTGKGARPSLENSSLRP